MAAKFLDPGMLTARLDLESRVETPDGQGGFTVSHAHESSHWARIEPVAADAMARGGSDGQAITHRIWIRHADTVRPAIRWRKGARIFVIRTVRDPDESGSYLVCETEEEG